MKAEIIAIGQEILRGRTLNSNAQFLSRELTLMGMDVSEHIALPDEFLAIEKGVKEALLRADLVVTTGGLGPTLDDTTRKALSRLLNVPIEADPKVKEDLLSRFGTKLRSLDDQSMVLKGAHVFINKVGTAPGFLFTIKEKTLVVLPGVPQEMKTMMFEDVIPELKKRFSLKIEKYSEEINFCLLIEDQVDPLLREWQKKYRDVEFGIYPAYGTLGVYLSGKEESVKAVSKELKKAFHDYLFPQSTLEESLQEQLVEEGKKLALAESCTGGYLSSKLTKVSGASDYFLGSFVTYSNELKENLLGVKKETLLKHGAVSEETVIEMAEAVLSRSSADFAISISGIAGPAGGTVDKPVGTIWGAIAKKDGGLWTGLIQKTHLNRSGNIEYAAAYFLSHFWRLVAYNKEPFS